MYKLVKSAATAAVIGAIIFGIYYLIKGTSLFSSTVMTDLQWVALAVWWVGTSIVNSIDDVVEKLGELVDLAKKAQGEEEYDEEEAG